MALDKIIAQNKILSGIITYVHGTYQFFPIYKGKMMSGVEIQDKANQLKEMKKDEFWHVDVHFTRKSYIVHPHFRYYDYSINLINSYSIQNEENPNATIYEAMKNGDFVGIVQSVIDL